MKNKISKLNKQVVIVCIATLLFMACSDNLSQQLQQQKALVL